MKLPIIACIWLFMSRVAPALREERTTYAFAGSNNYYLHALTSQEQTAYIHELQKDGAKAVRLWSKSPRITYFTLQALLESYLSLENLVNNCLHRSRWYCIKLHQIIQYHHSSQLRGCDRKIRVVHTRCCRLCPLPTACSRYQGNYLSTRR